MDKSGMRLGSLVTIVPPGGMTQLDRINLSLGFALPGAGLEGTLQLESDQDIIAWTSQIENLSLQFCVEQKRSVDQTVGSVNRQHRRIQIESGHCELGWFPNSDRAHVPRRRRERGIPRT